MAVKETGVVCRLMEKEDAAAVALLEASCSREAWSQKAYLDALNHENTVYAVALLEGKIVGCCGFWQSFEEADICNVAVGQEYRRQGIARQMLLFLMAQAAERDVAAFTLEVRKSNVAALSLYQNLGFATEGTRRNFYENPREDALILWKR